MTRRYLTPWLILLLMLAFGPSANTRAQNDEETILNPAMVVSALKEEGIRVEERTEKLNDLSEKEYLITIKGDKALAFVSTDGFTLLACYTDVILSPEQINEWNRTRRFSRACLTSKSCPVIVATMPGPMASTTAVVEFIQVYRSTLGKFRKFMIEQIEADKPES